MKLGTKIFGGMIPVVDDHNLPEQSATSARNCKLQSGVARPWAVPLTIQAAQHTGSIFLYKDIWLTWVSKLISAVLSPIANDSHGRLYWTGEGSPKYATEAMIGTSNAPVSSYDLGIPAPANAPVAVPVGLGNLMFAPDQVFKNNSRVAMAANTTVLGSISSNALLSYHSTGIAALDNNLFGFTIEGSNIAGYVYFRINGITSIGNGVITAITKANPAVCTCVGHKLITGDGIALNVAGMSQVNGMYPAITRIDDNNFSLVGVDSTAFSTFTSGTFEHIQRHFYPSTPVNITAAGGDNISKANPAKVTHIAHGLTTGRSLVLSNMVGMTQLSLTPNVTITYVDADNFTLDGIDSSGYGTFVSGTYTETPLVAAVSDTTQQELRSYVYRFLSASGEVGPPSPASAPITINIDQPVTLTGMDTAPVGNFNITDKEIFRTNTGTATTAYQFVDEVAIATTGYDDFISSEALGEVLDSLLWDAPPADLQGLTMHPCGSLVGYSGNLLCFSVPYQPHAWPTTNQYPVKDTIMGIGVYGNNVAVSTTGAPYVATGSDPSSMNVDRLEKGYANLSTNGIVDIGYAAAYPSTLGLMAISMNGIELVTEKILSIDEWQAYGPETFRGFFYGGNYFGLGDSKSLVLNLNTNDLSELDQLATAAHHDPATGHLYLVISGNIVKWDAGETNMTMLWQSKKYSLPRPAFMCCAKVLADAYPMTFTMLAKLEDSAVVILVAAKPLLFSRPAPGILKLTQTVSSNKTFRLPSGYSSEEIQYAVEGASGVYSVEIAESMAEIREQL